MLAHILFCQTAGIRTRQYVGLYYSSFDVDVPISIQLLVHELEKQSVDAPLYFQRYLPQEPAHTGALVRRAGWTVGSVAYTLLLTLPSHHLSVFNGSMTPANGPNTINWDATCSRVV